MIAVYIVILKQLLRIIAIPVFVLYLTDWITLTFKINLIGGAYMKLVINNFKKMDASLLKVKNNGLKFCFVLLLVATFILSLYLNVHNPALFLIGVSLFKSSLFFIVFFIICALAINTIKKDV